MTKNCFATLIDQIIVHRRSRAEKCKSFEEGDGAIRICFLPQGELGSVLPDWMTYFVDRYETVARISPNGNYNLHRNGLDGLQAVDCYAI